MSVRVLVRKRPDRADFILYYVDPITGREVSKTSGAVDRQQAERAAGVWEQELATYRGPRDDGWQYFRHRFEEEHLRPLASPTKSAYITALNHFERVIGQPDLTEVTASVVSTFQSKLLAEDRPLSSVCNYLRHLRTGLNWAERMGMIAKAPKVKLPREPRRSFMRGRPVTEAEYAKMLKLCLDPKLRRLIELLWLSGLRLSEALALSWDSPPVMIALAGRSSRLVFYAEGQKSRIDETVPMAPDLEAWLRKTPPKARRGLVAPVDMETQPRVSDAIGAIGRAAGIVVNETGRRGSDEGKYASAHDLRRSFGSRWAKLVMPPLLKRLMRHADISTTMKFYVGASAADDGRVLWEAFYAPKNAPKKNAKRQRAG